MGQVPHRDDIIRAYFEMGFSYQLVYYVSFRLFNVTQYGEAFFETTKSTTERAYTSLRVVGETILVG